MKKSERLNDMMIYLNGKNAFNLKDLIQKYHISRSTALRDIQSLEEIGMPIYSELGRNGYYGILPNRLLSPLVFTVDEMFALYFSMLTLKDYQSTPFHLSTTALKNKFEGCLSQDKINQVRRMEDILKMGSPKHFNASPFLKDLLTYAIENKVCEIEYKKESLVKSYPIQIRHITSKFGQWYVVAYSYSHDKQVVFRCDKIISVKEATDYKPMDLNALYEAHGDVYKAPDATYFKVEITQKGLDHFHKENYPSIRVEKIHDRFFISGTYNLSEEGFISQYFLSYGKQILSVYPDTLKTSIKKAIMTLSAFYDQMES